MFIDTKSSSAASIVDHGNNLREFDYINSVGGNALILTAVVFLATYFSCCLKKDAHKTTEGGLQNTANVDDTGNRPYVAKYTAHTESVAINKIWPATQNKSRDHTDGRKLRNLGNTCYFNAAIQCLASTPILKSQVVATAQEKQQITYAFLNFLAPIDPESGSMSTPLDPKPLLDAFCAKVTPFRDTKQHDSHELLRHFLDQLRQEERASWTNVDPTKKLTAVDKVFGGNFMTVYTCKKCETPYHVCEPFLDISVPICRGDVSRSEISEEDQTENTETKPPTPYQEAVKSIMERLSVGSVNLPSEILTIRDCLQYFTRQEMLGQQYMCNSCANDSASTGPDLQGDHKLTPATKQTLILNPPAVLVIHLKRFEMKSPKFEKRTNKIQFQNILDLAPYCSSWCLRNELGEQNIWYSLYAVVVHSGTLNRGHYVAYVKERDENKDIGKFLQTEYFDRDVTADQLLEMMQKFSEKGGPTISTKCSPGISHGIWYCMNDSSVSEVSFDEVMRKEAFLLFYERVSQSEQDHIYHL